MATSQRYPTSDEATVGTWGTAPFWSKVDDAADADYITCTGLTGGRGRQTFGFTAHAVPAGSTGISVAVNFRGKKAASQGANIGAALKVGGTYYDANGRNPATAFTGYSDSWANNPKSGTGWTVDDVNGVGANALQAFGVTTSDTTPNVSASSVEVVVTYTLPAITGSGGVSLPVSTLAGTGAQAFSGSGGLSLGFALAGTGTVEAGEPPAISGSGGLSVAVSRGAGSGLQTFTGGGGVSLPGSTLAGTGAETFSGTGGVSPPVSTLAATGLQTFSGSGGISLPVSGLAGSGLITGGGALPATKPYPLGGRGYCGFRGLKNG